VTGASSGIGLAAAQQLAREGAKVVMVARTRSTLEAAVQGIKVQLMWSLLLSSYANLTCIPIATPNMHKQSLSSTVCAHLQAQGGEAYGVVADVTKSADNKRIVEETLAKYGRLDVSFVNAGTGERVSITELDEDLLDKLLATNVKGVTYAFQYQLPAIEKSGGKGSILVNSSCAGSRATANPDLRSGGVYAASKAAANMLAQYAVSKWYSVHARIYSPWLSVMQHVLILMCPLLCCQCNCDNDGIGTAVSDGISADDRHRIWALH
jgi:NAD(P)-dependent dehydrogenase (short-subunit alcohol dehydrogenase family)